MTFLNEQLLYENQSLQDEIERLQARVDDLVDAISSGSHSQMMDALYNKQGESDDE